MSDDEVTIIIDQEGPPGPAAAVGIGFAWPGLIQTSEPPIPQTAPAAGTLTNAKVRASTGVNATADSVFTLAINGVGAGTITFHPGGTYTPALTEQAYAAGARIEAIPPVSPDTTLFGASFTLG